MPAEMPHDIVLVVDDSRDEVAMLVDALEQAGITALAATHGDAALALLDRVMPHLVVMDAVMPGLTGFETCRRLKAQPSLAHVPVIFMTGLTDTAHVLEGLQAGGVDYVTKPVIMEELIARIRVHLANARVALGARRALDVTGRHLMALDGGGRLQWATPQAQAVLSLGLAPAGDPVTLPADFVARARAAIATGPSDREIPLCGQAEQRVAVVYLCQTGPDEHLFRLAEAALPEEQQLRERHALTEREAEVLGWLTRGKANREISEILGISPRTVNKHLERIFAKLGVENRAAATSVAMRSLAIRS
jgi:DNA-binding response OmpR family regulator/DNA-binding CsgD family transcriptional regulator